MADDIDIEEHDILENPAIRHVFPDISIIKQEIDNYEKGLDVNSHICLETQDKVEAPSSNTCSQYLNAANISQLKIAEVVGAGDNDVAISPLLRTEKALVENGFARNNTIILGTSDEKMDYEDYETQVNAIKSKVIVNDVKSYLKNNERYCAECKILFPKKRFFDVHMNSAHDNYLNNVTEANTKLIHDNDRICLKYKCKLCLKIFPEKGINQHLLSHKDCKIMLNKLQDNGRTVHSPSRKGNIRYISVEEETKLRQKYLKLQSGVSGNQNELLYKCYVCTFYFFTKKNYIDHLNKKHGIHENPESVRICQYYDGQCQFCPSNFAIMSRYNAHIYYTHGKIYSKAGQESQARHYSKLQSKVSKHQKQPPVCKLDTNKNTNKHFRCYICTRYFQIKGVTIHHMWKSHGVPEGEISPKLYPSRDSFQCFFCLRFYKNTTAYNHHIYYIHKEISKKSVKLGDINSLEECFDIRLAEMIKTFERPLDEINCFYRCYVCTCYFRSNDLAGRHVTIVHGINENHEFLKTDFCSKCKFCPKKCHNIDQYNVHLKIDHEDIFLKKIEPAKISYYLETFQEFAKSLHQIQNNVKTDLVYPVVHDYSKFFRCFICSYYFLLKRNVINHLETKHHIKNTITHKRYTYDPKCWFCSRSQKTFPQYNDHLRNCHTKILIKKVNADIANNLFGKFEEAMSKYVVGDDKCSDKINQNEQQDKMEEDISTPRISHDSAETRDENEEQPIIENNTETLTKESNYYYRCTICSHYNKNVISIMEHITQEHDTNTEMYEKENFNPICSFCSQNYKNIDLYNSHLLSCTKTPTSNRINDSAELVFDDENEDYLQNMDCSDDDSEICTIDLKCYRCYVCAYHTNEFDCYHTHLAVEHSINKYEFQIPKMVKTRLVTKKISIESTEKNPDGMIPFLLKSGLFKCMQCDTYFLSAEIALNHANHITIPNNWECSICKRILKNEDRILHKKQHELSEDFKVYVIPPIPPSLVLYKCANCAIHFTEDKFIIHQLNCEDQDCDSAYCKICDILVDEVDGISHEADHLKRNLQPADITIVETEVITDYDYFVTTNGPVSGNSSPNNFKKNQSKSEHKTYSSLFYCDLCKCFLTSSERSHHLSRRCNHIRKKIICGICGVIFDKRFSDEHKNLHTEYRLYNLQDFKFYTVDGKLISPPIPEYLKCEKCEVVFWNKIDISKHSCNKIAYLTCSECEMKLTNSALKLHMAFHDYSFESATEVNLSNEIIISDSSPEDNNTDDSVSEDSVMADDVTNCKSPLNEIQVPKIIYECKDCRIIMTTYDKVVEHCQRHYISQATHREVILCEICSLIFDKECYERHKGIHENFGTKAMISLLSFDLFYFTAENSIWIKHVFQNLSELKIDEILSKSIYKSEHRIHMEIIQDGPSHLTVYLCESCQSCIEVVNLYKHADNSCFKLRKHYCSMCGLPFISSIAKTAHEKNHSSSDSDIETFRIVYFNQNKDKELNKVLSYRSNHYTLFQCRNCSGAMDQSQSMTHMCDVPSLRGCYECGLLFNKDHFDLHLLRHKELPKFIQKNMKVILFGESTDNTSNEALVKVSLYKGSIFDYTFYRCVNCEICTSAYSSTLTHSCNVCKTRLKCSDCELFFSVIEFKMHCKLHDTDLDFVRRNMRIITFGTIKKRSLPVLEDGTSTTQSTEETLSSGDLVLDGEKIERRKQNGDSDINVQKIINVYKCNCGVHFFSQDSMSKHQATCSPNLQRTPKQTCSKCNLLFTPNILFNHMVLHHGDLKLNYKYNIITSEMQN